MIALGGKLWKKALATGIMAISNSILIAYADPGSFIVYSWHWWRHLAIACVATFVVMEAKYWRDWAHKVLRNGNGNGIS